MFIYCGTGKFIQKEKHKMFVPKLLEKPHKSNMFDEESFRMPSV